MMPNAASREDWAAPLATFIARLRTDWDVPGVRAAIYAARNLGTPADIAIAAIELSRRSDLRTPALLAQDGPWWHTGRTPTTRVRPVMCTEAGHEYEAVPCRACRADELAAGYTGPSDPPTIPADQATTNHRGAATVRAAIRQPDVRELAAGEREGETDG